MPPVLQSKIRPVTVPSSEEDDEGKGARSGGADDVLNAHSGASVHTEMQRLLLKLGSDMGLDVWVAKKR